MKEFNVILLSAGKSQRMGKNKAFLEFKAQETFLERIVHCYSKAKPTEFLCVTSQEMLAEYRKRKMNCLEGKKIILNHHLEKGRFYSVFLAVGHLENDLPCFIQNIDNPFVTKEDIAEIRLNYCENGFTVPLVNNRGVHPILLSPEVVNQIRKAKDFSKSLKEFLSPFTKKVFSISNGKLQFNINTPEDYNHCFTTL